MDKHKQQLSENPQYMGDICKTSSGTWPPPPRLMIQGNPPELSFCPRYTFKKPQAKNTKETPDWNTFFVITNNLHVGMTCSKIPAHRIWDFFAQLVVCILEIEAPAQNSHQTNDNCTEQGLNKLMTHRSENQDNYCNTHQSSPHAILWGSSWSNLTTVKSACHVITGEWHWLKNISAYEKYQ